MQELQDEHFNSDGYEQDIAYPELTVEVGYSRTYAVS
jgi:hypothetical protein